MIVGEYCPRTELPRLRLHTPQVPSSRLRGRMTITTKSNLFWLLKSKPMTKIYIYHTLLHSSEMPVLVSQSAESGLPLRFHRAAAIKGKTAMHST